MFESHFGLRENPFVAAHQSRYIYPSPEHQEALAHLRFGIENREPFVLITGEVGTGKTTALFDALSEWEDRAIVGLITNSSLTRAELLEEIALRLGLAIGPGASKPQIMVGLEKHLNAIHAEGHRAILLLDEAQNLERELLEEIRLLSNLESGGEKLVQIFLVGQPELEARLGRPELRQLRQRIAVHYRLRPLGAADAERYIHHRIAVAGGHALSVFPPDACHEVHRLTNGIPREMNHLCAQAMVTAFVENASAVTVEHVRSAAQELEFQSVLGKERRTRNVTPAIERRQTPTVPGAAPPPDRTMPAPPPAAPRATAAPPAVSPPPVNRPAPAPPASPGAVDSDDDASAPPRWRPEAEAEEEVSGRAPDGGTESDEAAKPETTPPRLETSAVQPMPPATPVEPGTTGTAPAASGEEWQSWFKSLASEAAQGVESPGPEARPDDAPAGAEAPASLSEDDRDDNAEDSDEDDQDLFDPDDEAEDNEDPDDEDAVAEDAPPRFEAPGERPAARSETRPAPSAPPAPAPPATEERSRERVVEPAAPSHRFAEALRRAQHDPPARRDDRLELETGIVPPPRVDPRRGQPEPEDAPLRAEPVRRGPQNVPPRPVHSLPPRLRAKMEEDAHAEREPSRLPVRLMIALAILAVLLVGATLVQRFLLPGPTTTVEPAGAPDAAGENAPEAEDASDAAADGDNASGARAETRTTPAPARSEPPAERPSSPPPPPAPAATYVLNVGTYINEDRARQEQSRLDGLPDVDATIATLNEGNGPMFRVQVGRYSSRGAAERAASDLIARGLVDEARILTVSTDAR